MKVVFCWSGMSGYMAACWKELAQRPGVDMSLLVQWWTLPWSSDVLQDLPNFRRITKEDSENPSLICDLVAEKTPDVIVISGWAHQGFNNLPFDPRFTNCRFVMAMDTPWQGTWRQRIARLKIGRLIDRMDAVAVTGERCFQFARNLGVPESKILRGTYGIDYDAFRLINERRGFDAEAWPRRFLYVGRYEQEKGCDLLITAYTAYRQSVTDPWPLSCCGRGKLEYLIQGVEGIENHGFVQPTDLPEKYAAAGVFLLASRFEPWGQVILEASAAGLPVICTEACGVGVEVVRPYFSGLVVPTSDARALCTAMTWIHHHCELLPRYGKRAAQLAEAYSAQVWADRWTAKFNSLFAS